MDIFKKLRDMGRDAGKRRLAEKKESESKGASSQDRIVREVAGYLGVPAEEVEFCCGSVCPHCQMFLDKAIALEELGYTHHLFMNPVQEERFREAQRIYREDRAQYRARKQELMDRMRR